MSFLERRGSRRPLMMVGGGSLNQLVEAYAEGGLQAYERLGLLSGDESARWRERIPDVWRIPDIRHHDSVEGIEPGSELGDEARAAAEEYLGELVGQLTPLRRDLDPTAHRRNGKCDAAIWTLYWLGVLDDEALARWLDESWRKIAPWRTDPLDPHPHGLGLGTWIPPENEQQAAEDAAEEAKDAARAAKWATIQRIRRVIIGAHDRKDGLAIVALVGHGLATSLHFHYLGRHQLDVQPPPEEWQVFAGDPPEEALRTLSPPILRDDTGQTYQPCADRPESAGLAYWLRPVPQHREAITGYWLYTSALSPEAHEFTVEYDDRAWTLRNPTV